MLRERSEMEWKEEHDILLCREILVSQPFKLKERTVERGKIWDEIANRLNNCQTLKFRVNKRSVTERFKLLYPYHLYYRCYLLSSEKTRLKLSLLLFLATELFIVCWVCSVFTLIKLHLSDICLLFSVHLSYH